MANRDAELVDYDTPFWVSVEALDGTPRTASTAVVIVRQWAEPDGELTAHKVWMYVYPSGADGATRVTEQLEDARPATHALFWEVTD